ncbi:MAG: aldo/keto reductase [Candidatus Accumulibacter sp.]|nr:aldo/keto reductase [Accumulibacter sp.]
MDSRSMTRLNNGLSIPLLALGVWRASEVEAAKAVCWAIEAGCRHIDTAAIYRNEEGVGKGLRDSGVPREEIFVTTKLWNDDMRSRRQRQAFEESLERLQTDYVDLYLIHWPVEGVFVESWKILEEIYESGRAKAIGVSNFHERHLDELLESAAIPPATNQIECHPWLSQAPLIARCAREGIVCEAWSPLGGLGAPLSTDPELLRIAGKYGKTPLQIALRWNIQRGVVVLPKSIHRERIAENARLYDFELDEEDMKAIGARNQDHRFGPSPDDFDF